MLTILVLITKREIDQFVNSKTVGFLKKSRNRNSDIDHSLADRDDKQNEDHSIHIPDQFR